MRQRPIFCCGKKCTTSEIIRCIQNVFCESAESKSTVSLLFEESRSLLEDELQVGWSRTPVTDKNVERNTLTLKMATGSSEIMPRPWRLDECKLMIIYIIMHLIMGFLLARCKVLQNLARNQFCEQLSVLT